MAVLKALPGAPDFKALPGSAKINGEPIKDNQPIEGKLISIKKSVINIGKFLDRKKKQTEKQKENFRKRDQNFKRKKKEEKLEEPKKEWKKLVPKKVPGLSFFDSIRKFVTTWILGFVAIKLIPLLPKLIPFVLRLGKVVNWFINIGGAFLSGFISFIDFGIKAQEATFGFLKTLGGEKFANAMANFAKGLGGVIDAMLLTGIFLISEAMTGDSGLGLITDWIGDKLMKKVFGKTATSALTKTGATSALTKTGATSALTKTGATSALTKTGATTATTAGGGAAGGGAGGAAGIGAGAAAGIVAGAGLLASGLGEGFFQIKKVSQQKEAESYKKFKDKGWWNPMKYFWGAKHLVDKFNSYFFGTIGVLLDIIGAPFRYIIELIRYPFLSEEGKKKQAENLAKFDARIREQFREMVNAFSLGLLAKEKGAFGSMFGKKGTDAMGYTKDGKTKSQQVPGKKGTVLLSTPHLEKTKDFLQGKSSGEKVHSILKVSDGSSTESDKEKTSNVKNGEQKTTQLESKKSKGKAGAIIGGLLGAAAFGPLGAIAGAVIGKDIQKRGIKGVIGGIADFMTLGMFDFDKQNRKGAPKDFGIRRIAGGIADWATMGLTDFDKRGKGMMQFNPLFGGKDKAWGSRNEQAKRGEKQSGFGLKRGIGGLLDFATLGMFDFDKQNRKGAPKGFGIKRIVGGLADNMTMGLTDFDQRGAGLMQFDPIGGGKDKAWGKEAPRNARKESFRNKTNELRNMSQFATKDGRTISMYDMLTSGDRSQIEEALYMQRAKERDPSEGHSDWVGNPKYEAETLKYLKPSSTNETPLKLGKQPVKFDEELLGVSASYETDGGQKEFVVYAPTTQINMLPGNDDSGQLVTSGATASSGDDPYEILEKGN